MAYLAPPSLLMPPPLPEHHRSSSSDYYYFVLTMSIMAVMLVVSNIIAFTCCSHSYVAHNLERLVLNRRNSTVINRAQELVPLSKYKKAETYDTDCSVCLTGFTEGEEVRQLPKCKHSFHAPCIDMWLYSHSNCPVCRMAVEGLPPPQPSPRAPEVRRPLFTESPNLGQVVVTIM